MKRRRKRRAGAESFCYPDYPKEEQVGRASCSEEEGILWLLVKEEMKQAEVVDPRV
jgi:hypothetical protein